MRRPLTGTAWLVAGVLLAGCGQTAPAAPSPASPSAVSPQPTSAAVSPAPSVPTGQVPVDGGASLGVAPVDYEGASLVRATFGAAHRAGSRPVALQRRDGSTWQQVAVEPMNRSGTVVFLAAAASGTFRAVALATGTKPKAVATPAVKASDQWTTVLDSGFGGSSLPAPWGYRLTDVYDAGGRWCSAPRKANVGLGSGTLTLTMSKASAATAKRVAAAAKSKQARAGQKTAGCPGGVYDNAMISTQGRFSLPAGIFAARVKFPAEQGAHASVWLQSDAGQELDMVETFGYGRGITNVIHVKGVKHPADGKQTYVASSTVADAAWWDEWHTVSLEWDRTGVRFRLDGVVTRELKVPLAPAHYFPVISLLSSDWETYRLSSPDARPGSGVDASSVAKPVLPFAMEVDWVRAWRAR